MPIVRPRIAVALVVGGSDPTVTLIDLFNTTTSVITSGSPSNQNDAVTFTATVAENPGQAGADPTGTVQFLDGATPLTCTEGGVNGIRPLSGRRLLPLCAGASVTSLGNSRRRYEHGTIGGK